TFVRPTASTSRYDWATQCKVWTANGASSETMHCCPGGQAMVGIAVADRTLYKCRDITGTRVGNPFLDTGTQRTIAGVQMHAWPPNAVMVGVQQANNHFACQGVTLGAEMRDVGSQDAESGYSMHVCSGARAMTGLQITQNQLGCALGAVTN